MLSTFVQTTRRNQLGHNVTPWEQGKTRENRGRQFGTDPSRDPCEIVPTDIEDELADADVEPVEVPAPADERLGTDVSLLPKPARPS